MRKSIKGLVILGVSSLILTGCGKQPQTFAEAMYGKSAEESASMALKQIKFPVTYKNGRVLENVTLDSNDKTMVVYHYKETKLVPKAGKENVYLGQEETLNEPNLKKSIVSVCDRMYPYFQNGAKNKYINKWSNGKVYQEYMLSKEVCDNL